MGISVTHLLSTANTIIRQSLLDSNSHPTTLRTLASVLRHSQATEEAFSEKMQAVNWHSRRYFSISILLLSFMGMLESFVAVPSKTVKFMKRKNLTAVEAQRDQFFDFEDIEDYAKISGLILNCTSTGPFLRIEAFPIGETELIGYLTAFIRPVPFGLFHLDTIKVKNRRQNLGYQRKTWTIDGPGISFIMGSYALRWAFDRGCRKSQLLAVNDTPLMHAILIRLYASFGFDILREVTEDTVSTGDRLIWGAIGTLMELDIRKFFTEWTPKLEELSTAAKTARIKSGDTSSET